MATKISLTIDRDEKARRRITLKIIKSGKLPSWAERETTHVLTKREIRMLAKTLIAEVF